MAQNDHNKEKKVTIITGSSRSIGQAVAREFLKEGSYRVMINGSDEAILNQAAIEILKTTSNKRVDYDDNDLVIFPGDVSQEDTSKALINEVVQRFGRIDVLVNNAEVLYNPQRLINRIGSNDINNNGNIMLQPSTPYFTLEEYEFTDESLSGAYMCSREAARWWISNNNDKDEPDMSGKNKKNNYSIINISHCYNSIPESAEEVFTGSKSGVDLFTYSKENTKTLRQLHWHCWIRAYASTA